MIEIHDWPLLDREKLFDYLRWNSYRSERHKLFYVATPKVACTSLKWWFAALEGYSKALRGSTDSFETDADLVIHDTFHRVAPNVTGLMPEALSEALTSDLYFRFAVVRNPYKRIFSAWQSKLLLKEPRQIGPYLRCDFVNRPIECAGDIAAAFEGFLEHLATSEAPSYWDVHWTPQVTLLRPDLIHYSKLVKIENAQELSQVLAKRLGENIPNPFANRRRNESLIPYITELVTERSSELIRSLYAEDFETFGYGKQLPAAKETFSADQFDLAFKAIALIRGRHQRLGERNRKIVSLNQAAAERDGQVASLNQVVGERDGQITSLNQAVTEREGQITSLNQAVYDKDLYISNLSQILTERDTQVTGLNQTLQMLTEQAAGRENVIRQILSSTSWRMTKPVRFFKQILNKILTEIKYVKAVVVTAIKRTGGTKNAIRKSLTTLMKEGTRGGIVKLKKQAYYTRSSIEGFEGKANKGTAKRHLHLSDAPGFETKSNVIKFNSSGAILFVGHDALLAGAQVLLLSLIKWFSAYSGIGIKVILLHDGVLLDKFNKDAATLVWADLVQKFPDKEKRRAELVKFIERVDLIYGNTVLAPSIYDELDFLNVPCITHVHELEKSIRMYIEKTTINKMRLFTDGFIAASSPVALNLVRSHGIDENKIVTINDFIEKREINFAVTKKDLRKSLGLTNEALIILGCGTIYWRKGVDLFIDTALRLKQKGYLGFRFYWIGENIWDLDPTSHKLCSWSDLEQKISDAGLQAHVTFVGSKEAFVDYFLAADIFYLPSREDPFPLVCLEAAQCGIPIICFDKAGGMPDFVEDDAGFVAAYEDVGEVAEKIIFLDRNRDVLAKLGAKGREKFLLRHSLDIAAPEILVFCRKIGKLRPLVSVIVPNYNCERFLAMRLDSIINQSFKNFEIIVLDDASTDQSLQVIEKYLHLPFLKLVKSQTNSGSPFAQWHKGFLHAEGDILWFAEADDFCEPTFLQKLLPSFNNDYVALAYCDSVTVDASGRVIGDYQSYLNKLDSNHWESSYQVTASQEISFGLGVKNSIPNASAVLIRKSCVSEAIFRETLQFRFSGDWYFYTQAIKGKGVSFCSDKLNFHRKHDQTVSAKFNTDKSATQLLLKEAELVHRNILKNYSISGDYLKKWERYITEQILALYPNTAKEEFENFYPYNSIKEKIKEAIIQSEASKRLVFLTTNDGAADGGSEQLWIETAIECRKRGHDVMVVIKKWDPNPYFIQKFADIGIITIFKGSDDFRRILMFQPDLLIVSTGDMDEGIEWYDRCRKHNICYVIINQLTKEPQYWPIRRDINEQVKRGYLGAARVFFTCNNNLRVMERRLNCEIPNASIHYNPFHIDRKAFVPFPSIDDGLKIAIPANFLRVHKGQHLAIELFSLKKWKERPIQLNLYGEGDDEQVLKAMAKKRGLDKVWFHKPSRDLLSIWRDNHAIFMPSFMEGLPVVLVGAMICCRVPILTDIGGHREVVDDNINGFIAAKPTVDALDEALERAYQKSAIWEEMGKKARQSILDYLPEDPVGHFIDLILLLANKSTPNQCNSGEYGYVETKVHPKDEMYLFFTTHPDHRDTPLESYFASGVGMKQSLLEILNKIGVKIEGTTNFLEFACGYGRFTRHLVRIIRPEKITCADVYTEAVDFEKKVFGVKGFYSEFNPKNITLPEKYDIIFVASLFSHLPLKTWRPWLNKLYHSLNENGVIIFSTHGKFCMANLNDMPDNGFLYCHMSESKILPYEEYATTYVTSEFVHKAVMEETGEFVLLEVPKGLWGYQDVYVVRRSKIAIIN